MVEPHNVLASSLLSQPHLPGGFEQRESADDVRLDERRWAEDRAIDVSLCREVHNGIDLVSAKQIQDELAVADVPMDEDVAIRVGEVGQVLGASGICEGVKVDNMGRLLGIQDVSNEIGSDETCPARHQKVAHLFIPWQWAPQPPVIQTDPIRPAWCPVRFSSGKPGVFPRMEAPMAHGAERQNPQSARYHAAHIKPVIATSAAMSNHVFRPRPNNPP